MPFDLATWPAAKVRQAFIDHFVNDGDDPHTFYASSPVVPYDDPTLLFCNAGMNQFKPLFLGTTDPKSPLHALSRACNSQKCIRAGGKHNDLDDVGKDTYHHTFFEMLGNWSFGAYFKRGAIEKAFTLLTKVYGLSADRIYATYFGGDAEMNLPADDEARNMWLKVLPATHVLPFDRKDNFWEMGDTGPCGPCTELHFDRLGGRDASGLVNADDPTVIEIWNLVFMQYNREANGELRPLPAKHVDTGMGFERIVSILQGAMSNYDTDVFVPIFDAIHRMTGCRRYTQRLGEEDVDGVDMAYRVVADHIRTLTIAIADGAVPSSDGRGYVLRRILRRAVRYGHEFLGAEDGFFAALIDAVVDSMAEPFPELASNKAAVVDVVRQEEKTFAKTLEAGTKKFKSIVASFEGSGASKQVSGVDAFFLYDTMGFPVDLTQRMAEEQGLTVDEAAFENLLQQAKAVSRADRDARSAVEGGRRLVLEAEETAWLAVKGVHATLDEAKYVWNENPCASVMAIFVGRSEGASWVDSTAALPPGSSLGVITDATSFYAESGGQVADVGTLRNDAGVQAFDVLDVRVAGGYVLHVGKMTSDGWHLRVGCSVSTCVDYGHRSKIAPNHTMTHVLNHALRDVLGDGADQKGSVVDAAKLRFDFSHNKALSQDQLQRVERLCRDTVAEGRVVSSQVAPYVKAKGIYSLRAVFGEVYPDPVRVVSIGSSVDDLLADPGNEKWRARSVEFCGGTHVSNTSEAKAFVLLEETAVAAGIRRIFGLTGDAAVDAMATGELLQARMAAAESLADPELGPEVSSLTSAVNKAKIPAVLKASLQKRVAVLAKRSSDAAKSHAKVAQKQSSAAAMLRVEEAKDQGAARCVVQVFLGGDGKGLSKLVTDMAVAWPQGSIMALTVDEAKMALKVSAMSTVIPCNAWVSGSLACVGGKGGGKPTSGSGSAKLTSLEQVSSVIEAATSWLPAQ
jgi:alanyl-tRNA synthetase